MTPISKRKHALFYKYKNQNKLQNIYFIQKKPDNFQKARQFALRFHTQKVRHFILRDFYEFLKFASIYIYTNHDTFRYVTFLYTKSQTLRKKKDNLSYIF